MSLQDVQRGIILCVILCCDMFWHMQDMPKAV